MQNIAKLGCWNVTKTGTTQDKTPKTIQDSKDVEEEGIGEGCPPHQLTRESGKVMSSICRSREEPQWELDLVHLNQEIWPLVRVETADTVLGLKNSKALYMRAATVKVSGTGFSSSVTKHTFLPRIKSI